MAFTEVIDVELMTTFSLAFVDSKWVVFLGELTLEDSAQKPPHLYRRNFRLWALWAN
jgi:hypothetical protein